MKYMNKYCCRCHKTCKQQMVDNNKQVLCLRCGAVSDVKPEYLKYVMGVDDARQKV